MVTIPSVGYLIQPQLNKSSGHGHDEGGHGEHDEKDGHGGVGEGDEKSEGNEDSEAENPEGGEDASDGDSKGGDGSEDRSEEQSAGSGSDDRPRPDHSVQDAGQGNPETSSGEDPKAGAREVDSGSDVEGVQFKGATSGGTREGEQGDTRKHIPDAKGFNKKRIESDYGKEQGRLEGEDSGGSDKVWFLSIMEVDIVTDGRIGRTFQATKRIQYDISEAGRTLEYQYQTLHRYGQ